LKVIFIIPFPPVYENFNSISIKEDDLFDSYQFNRKGEKVIFFRQEWGCIIGGQIMKADNNIRWEVWRPDFRVDNNMSFTSGNELVCRSFPQTYRTTFYGIKPVKIPYSKQLEESLICELAANQDIVVMLPTTVEFSRFLHARIQRFIPRVLYYHFLNSEFLLPQFDFTLNPFKMIHRVMINFQKTLRLHYIQNIQVLSDELLALVQSRYQRKKVILARIGIDLPYWQNVLSKKQSRKILGLDNDIFVFLLSQRLVPEYQIDRWIEALEKVKNRHFICIITGTGEKEYVDYLSNLVSKRGLENNVKLVGFVSNELLRTYLITCDCFVMSGKKGGGSTGSLYAMNIEKLVMHSDSGVSYEILKKFNAGVIIKSYEYRKWPATIEDVLEKKTRYGIVPKGYIQSLFNWDKCAQQWLEAVYTI
jgi:glycosyltransferase involved in cell wall biosynthesis